MTPHVHKQHPPIEMPVVRAEEHESLLAQSSNRYDRYGCLLFRHCITEEMYAEWQRTTNWDGCRGKTELPENLKKYVEDCVKNKFQIRERRDMKLLVDRVNECLRSPRLSAKVRRSIYN